MPLNDKIKRFLEAQKELDCYRELIVKHPRGVYVDVKGKSYLNLASNDYLNLSQNPQVIAATHRVIDEIGVGSCSSRLVSGTFYLHEHLEEELSRYQGSESALLFSSGYLANLGLISSLACRDDIIFIDKLVHASLVDASVLSRAKLVRFKHNDLEQLESLLAAHSENRKSNAQFFIVSESVFSMDGDLAPTKELALLADRYQAQLIIDLAHGFGVFPPAQLSDVIYTATLSKAFGSYGGVVFSSKLVREFLINKARSFIYNTSLPAALISASLASLSLIRENKARAIKLLETAAWFREELTKASFDLRNSQTQIVPLVLGSNRKVLDFSEALKEEGVLSHPMRAPTVPAGSERIRFSLTSGVSREDLLPVLNVCMDLIQ